MGDWWCQRGGECFTDVLHVIMCNVEVGSIIYLLVWMGYNGNGTEI